jgi:3-isopropylmalate/(R)-2-methylmalate dehydratase small subunit
VLIAPGKDEGFADIFEGNAFNNGLLPIELPEPVWQSLAEAGSQPCGAELVIDLPSQTLTLHRADGSTAQVSFYIPEAQRQRLLSGLDAIAETLSHDVDISRHELQAPAWITPAPTG